MLVATGVTAASGFVFWLVAARSSSSSDVGAATGLLSSVYFIAYVTNMGLGVAVGRYAVDESDLHRARFAAACLYTTVTGVVGAVVYLVLIRGSETASVLGPAGLWFFVFVSVGASLGPLTDVRQMARRRWGRVVARAGAVLVGRVVLVVAVLALGPERHRSVLLFVGAAAPDALSGVVVAAVLARHGLRRIVADRRLPSLGGGLRYANVNYVSQLAVQGPLMVTPVIVLLNVSAEDNAAFYVAWGFFTVALLVPQAMTAALHVEGKKDGVPLRAQLSLGLKLACGASLACVVASLLLSVLIPLVYGSHYRLSGQLLPLLVVAALPWSVVLVRLTAARVEERTGATLLISVFFAASTLLPMVVLTPHLGTFGAPAGWLIGTLSTALVAVVVQWRLDVATANDLVDGRMGSDDGDAAGGVTAAGDLPILS